MLSFTTSLTNALSKTATQSYWLLRLYFNDESSFTGISDRTRTIGGVIYYGLASWGNHNQTLNIDQFTTSNGTMQVKLDNSPNKIDGKRFSDLLADNNYANRKWELFQCDENADFSTDNIIAGGIISSDFKHTPTSTAIYLNDYWAKYNIEIPLNRVTNALDPNAPEKNIGIPRPIWIGDYQTDNLTAALNTYEYQKYKVPAVITNKWNDDETGTTASSDFETVDEITNVFLYINNQWAVTDDTPTISNPDAIFKGTVCKAFFSLTAHEDECSNGTCPDYEEAFDGDGDTAATWNIAGVSAPGGFIAFSIPDIVLKSLGKNISAITVKLWGSLTGTVTDDIIMFTSWEGGDSEANVITINAGLNEYDITGDFSAAELSTWSFQKDVLTIQVSNVEDMVMFINEIGIEITFEVQDNLIKPFVYEIAEEDKQFGGTDIRSATRNYKALGDIETVYVTGQGRILGSWIENGESLGRTNGFSTGGLIENPIYAIETILRDELGLTKTEINTVSFDAAGNTTDGDIENTFNSNATAIDFAFSQYKLITSRNLITKICKQCGSYIFWSGDQIKIKARRRTYTSVEKTIDFKDIKIIDFALTPMDDVYNYISLDYAYDYGLNKTTETITPDDDAGLKDNTSISNATVDGYGQTLKLPVDMPFSKDLSTVNNYGDALLAWFKDRKQIITFDTKIGTAKYNALEIGDIINFSNWDSNLKVLGDTITTADGFMITQITKRPNGCRIQVTEVAGTIS